MPQNAPTSNSSDGQDNLDPMDSLAWRRLVAALKVQPQDDIESLGIDMEARFTAELCREGLSFHCSERALYVGGLCWAHFADEMCRLRPTSPSSDPTTPSTPPAAPLLSPIGGYTALELPPVTETCHLGDLLLTTNILADDGDATSEYDEAGAPPTEGGDVDGQYESSEVDDGAAAFDFLEGDDPVLLLAASIPLPGAEEEDDLEEVNEPTGSTFRVPGVNWSWPSEASVASLVKSKPDTCTLLRIFPPAQGYAQLASGRFRCTARARISRDTGRWEAYDCDTTCERQYDWRRHFLTIHIAGSRWEDVARQKKVDADDSTSTAALVPKKPRAKRVPKQAQPLASTSASASTSTAGPPPEVRRKKPRQKRKRQVTEDENSEDGYEDWDQGGSDRKGKKARRW